MHASPQIAEPAPRPEKAAPVPANTPPSEPMPSADLLKGAKSVVIEHNGTLYRLQATKLGKLILTK